MPSLEFPNAVRDSLNRTRFNARTYINGWYVTRLISGRFLLQDSPIADGVVYTFEDAERRILS